MLYTFDLLRHPLKIVPISDAPVFRHRFGGPLQLPDLAEDGRVLRVLTLDLDDPLLSFLRFPLRGELPLLMDFSSGAIAYSATAGGGVQFHEDLGDDESMFDDTWHAHPARLEAIPYEQYRAGVFASTIIDRDFLSPADREAEEALGESFSQVGGHSLQGARYQPYCTNPECPGFGRQVMSHLATISQEPAPGMSMYFLPGDPALDYAFCQTCHAISGSVST